MAERRPSWAETLRWLQEVTNERAADLAELIVQEIEMDPDTPTDTGFLRSSFEVVRDGDDVLVIGHAPYWEFVEYGARGKEGQGYLRRAIETVAREFS